MVFGYPFDSIVVINDIIYIIGNLYNFEFCVFAIRPIAQLLYYFNYLWILSNAVIASLFIFIRI